jgi:hypothetical protein
MPIRKKSSRRKMSRSGRINRTTRSSRSNSRKRRPTKKVSATKKPSRIVFVKGKARTARPKSTGTGYYYNRKGTDGRVHKVTVNGKTFSPKDAKKRISNTKRRY